MLPLSSIQRSLGSSANAEKSEIDVFQARIPSKLSIPARGDTSVIGLPSMPMPFNLTNPESGDKSLIPFSSRPSQSTLIRSESGDTSVIRFPRNLMLSKRTNPASGDRSDIALCRNSMRSNLRACSSPVRLRMPFSSASMRVNLARSVSVIGSLGALPSVSAIAARRFGSGIKLLGVTPSKIGFSRSSRSGVGQSLPYKQATTSSKLDVHTSLFTLPSLSNPVKPKFCKPGFSRICCRSASGFKPTAAAACAAFSEP